MSSSQQSQKGEFRHKSLKTKNNGMTLHLVKAQITPKKKLKSKYFRQWPNNGVLCELKRAYQDGRDSKKTLSCLSTPKCALVGLTTSGMCLLVSKCFIITVMLTEGYTMLNIMQCAILSWYSKALTSSAYFTDCCYSKPLKLSSFPNTDAKIHLPVIILNSYYC